MPEQTTPILELCNVSKRYGGAVALANVDFALRAGEVHGLVGENGAGKSTMMKLLAGVYHDYVGEMRLRDQPVRFTSPADAQAKGIGMVYQELSTFQHLTVAENLFSRQPPTRGGLVQWKHMNQEAQAHLRELGLNIDVTNLMGRLSVGTQQLVEIARVIFSGAQIIILDEPTSALSGPETRRLFNFIATLKAQGKTIIFISHFLEDVLEVTDRITVLKNAHKVATLDTPNVTKHQLVELMIGSDAKILQQMYEQDQNLPRRPSRLTGETALTVDRLSRPGAFHQISFELHKGEILGLFGFMGAGQIQLARCLFGAERPTSGVIMLNNQKLNLKNTTIARNVGIAYVPENRRNSLMLEQEIYKNITLAHLGRLLHGLLNQRTEVTIARTQIEQVGVRPPQPFLRVGALSGGNQQKVVLAKWLTQQPKLLILNEPTRGMDVGAKDEVLTIVQKLRDQGVAILLITTEPETIVRIADRSLVMSKGRLTAELSGVELTKENLMKHA
ncbi:MAG: sugar ABC transporter ATP-binding protein [Chloroflexi bacterium]|nr:sugar ABC transporter ATP-binding protein [Chloroflexota bacterium]